MREKYESLPLVQLKELAKVRGLKGTSTMKKAEIIEAMLAEDERLANLEGKTKAAEAHISQSVSSVGQETQMSQPVDSMGQAEQQSHPEGRTGQRTSPARRLAQPAQQSDSANPARRPASAYSPKRRIVTNNARPANYQQHADAPAPAVRNEGNYNATYVAQPQNVPMQGAPAQSAPMHSAQPQAVQSQTADYVPRVPRNNEVYDEKTYPKELDSGEEASGILEVMPDGYGFIRCENYLPGENDVYVAPSQIRRFGLKTGDILKGNKRIKTQQEKFSALLFIHTINGYTVEEACKRQSFEDMTPIFPNEKINLETPGSSIAMRVMDLICPVGKGQRGMIVSPPKAGKTTLLKEVAKSILRTNPQMHMIILLIDERPEEVTDIKEAIIGNNVEVIYSTFDELPEHHKRVSEMAIERAKRLVEHKKDVVILLDSITRLARAYNLVVPPSGRTLSGGLDPAALHMPKRFFGAARNIREGGSLTILATALVDTGSKMDDVVYEEFKGTGNMEMILDRKLSEKRIFPAIDIAKSGTRREDLLLTSDELEAINIMRKALNGLKADEAADRILDLFARTKNNREFVQVVKKNHFV